QALPWREPAPANRLLSELRSDGLVVEVDRYGQPEGPPAWRLSDEGHLVASVCAVLAAPTIAPERAVKVLAAAMALARAAGVDERAPFAPFVAATAVLERDLVTLHRLIDQGADDALATAAEVGAVHLADLVEMARQVARPGGHAPARGGAAAARGARAAGGARPPARPARLHALVEEVRGSPVPAAPEPHPGAPEPHPPGPGAPEREGSPTPGGGRGAVHSPGHRDSQAGDSRAGDSPARDSPARD